MIALQSSLENKESEFAHLRRDVSQFGFIFGGNWDYHYGFFDKNLDEQQKVWLRLPFTVTYGRLAGDIDQLGTTIRLGAPYVLKHLYEEGLDDDARMRTFGALVDQFQSPVDEDADVEDEWVLQAQQLLTKMEQQLLQ